MSGILMVYFFTLNKTHSKVIMLTSYIQIVIIKPHPLMNTNDTFVVQIKYTIYSTTCINITIPHLKLWLRRY